jgi:hypothetical protein
MPFVIMPSVAVDRTCVEGSIAITDRHIVPEILFKYFSEIFRPIYYCFFFNWKVFIKRCLQRVIYWNGAKEGWYIGKPLMLLLHLDKLRFV